MADNIKQIKVEGVAYDLNAKYIQDSSGNPKTWQNITDLINAGVKLVTDTARKEGAGDGGIGCPATTAAASTMGKIYLIADDGGISGTYVEFITIDKGADTSGTTGYVRYVWEKIGTTTADLTNYVQKGRISLSGTAATAGATATGSAGAGAAANTGDAGAINSTISITDTAGAPTVTGSAGGSTVNTSSAGAATVTAASAGGHTHTVTVAAHSHTVNCATATLVPITAVDAATGSAGGHTHSITPTTATISYATGATLSAAGAATITSSSSGAHTHSVTIAAHSHSVTVGAHTHTITPTTNTFSYTLTVAAHNHSYTKPTAHTHTIAQHTHSVSVSGNNY